MSHIDKKELEAKLKEAGTIRFTEHALFQMKMRQIARSMITEHIAREKPFDFVIEKDPRGKKYTAGYKLSNSRNMYITLKFKNQDIYIITALISKKKVIEKIRKRLARWKKSRK